MPTPVGHLPNDEVEVIGGHAGPIGGRAQKSDYRIDCRFNKDTIAERILNVQRLAKEGRIVAVLSSRWQGTLDHARWYAADYDPKATIIYLDPLEERWLNRICHSHQVTPIRLWRGAIDSRQGQLRHRRDPAHVPTVSNQAVQDAFARWEVAQARPDDESRVTDLCVPVSSLPTRTQATDVRFSITVDGSEAEVEATRAHPTVKVGYIRVAGSLLEIAKLNEAGKGPFVDPRMVSDAHQAASFDAALPGSGLVQHGYSGIETWRREVDHFLQSTRFDDGSPRTLADALLTLHGAPGQVAAGIGLRTCPSHTHSYPAGGGPVIGKEGGQCQDCGAALYLADVLRTHDEYNEESSNQLAITRTMNIAEHLMTLSYLDLFYAESRRPLDMFRNTIFVTDGPLALFGGLAPLKRRFHDYLQQLFTWSDGQGTDLPLMVGVEKTGRFVEHAELIRDLIPEGHVMRLPTAYINRITGRPYGNRYGTDEFYGRRFIYRTSAGDPLVITVPPKAGILPYEGPGAEDLDSYPTLRTICEVLDGVRTRLYPNAVIPVALAHSSAALPLGVGQSVLRALAQKGVGLPENTQIRNRPAYR